MTDTALRGGRVGGAAAVPGRRAVGWRARLAALLLAVLPLTAMTAGTAHGQVVAFAPAPLPASLVPAAVGTGPGVVVAGAVLCVIYCADAYRWVKDTLSDAFGGSTADGRMIWHTVPPQGAEPQSVQNSQWAIQVMPKRQAITSPYDTFTPPGGRMRTYNVQVRTKCQGEDGITRMSGHVVSKSGVVPDNSDALPLDFVPNCSAFTPAYTGATRVLAVEVKWNTDTVDDNWSPAGPAKGTTLVWKGTPTYKGKVETTCYRPSDGQRVVGPAPIVALPPGETLSVPAVDCEDVLPGSYPETTVGSSGAGWAAPATTALPVQDFATNLGPTAGTYPSCFTSPGCKLEPSWDPDTGTSVCKWGPYTMPDSDCAGQAPATAPPTTAPTTAPTGNPTTGPTPRPSAAPSAVPLLPPGMPVPAGTPVITTQPGTNGAPGTTTWTYPDGTTVTNTPNPNGTTTVGVTAPDGTTTTTVVATPVAGGGTQPDPDGSSCIGNAWSWNPVDWVYWPTRCALSWAFVPSQASVQGVQAAGAELGSSVPFSWFGDVAGWAGGFSSPGSDCFTLNVATGHGAARVLDTCNRRAFEQWLADNRAALNVAMFASFLMPIGWWAWRQYAPGSTGVA